MLLGIIKSEMRHIFPHYSVKTTQLLCGVTGTGVKYQIWVGNVTPHTTSLKSGGGDLDQKFWQITP